MLGMRRRRRQKVSSNEDVVVLAVAADAVEAVDAGSVPGERGTVVLVAKREHGVAEWLAQHGRTDDLGPDVGHERPERGDATFDGLVIGQVPHIVTGLRSELAQDHRLALGRGPGHGERRLGDPEVGEATRSPHDDIG